MSALGEDEAFLVAIDLRHLAHAARAMQFSLGSGQLLTTRDAREGAAWEARHMLEQMVAASGLTEHGDALRPDLTPWLYGQVALVLDHATDPMVSRRAEKLRAAGILDHQLTERSCG